MSKAHRSFALIQKRPRLKPKANNPLGEVITNDWFIDYPPNLAIQFRGSSHLFDYIITKNATLTLSQIHKIDASARYASITTGLSATSIVDIFLENSNTIWDFTDRNYMFQDDEGTTPISGLGQSIRSFKPLSGTDRLVTVPGLTPIQSTDSIGCLFPNTPSSGYQLTTKKSPKTVILSLRPEDQTEHLNVTYPFTLSIINENLQDFHPGTSGEIQYFSPIWSFGRAPNVSVMLNNLSLARSALLKNYNLHLLTIKIPSNEIAEFNSVSCDRFLSNGFQRRYVGEYRLVFSSNNVYTDTQISALNQFCQVYSRLI